MVHTNGGTDNPGSLRHAWRVPEDRPDVVQRGRRAFGSRVRDLRRERGLTQDELAKRAGFERKSINRIENGAFSPTLDRVFLLAASLGVTAAELLDEGAPGTA